MPVIPTNSDQTNKPLHIPILYYVSTFTIALFLNVQLLCDFNRSSYISPSYNKLFNCTSEFSILFQFILMKKFCPVKASSHFFIIIMLIKYLQLCWTIFVPLLSKRLFRSSQKVRINIIPIICNKCKLKK